jgi:histidinol-phosphate aminotransferase
MLTPRPGILEIDPYVGGDASAPGAVRVIRLASNENPLGCGKAARAAYRSLSGELHRYPDGAATALREAIAESEGLDAARIVCGTGSDELISLLTNAYAGPGDEVLYSEHGFLMYPIAARSVGAEPVAAPETELTADVEALLSRVSARTRICFLANPNNPTGSYLSAAALRRLREELPSKVLLVVDAAYAEYVTADNYANGRDLVEARDDVVMTRTFSKVHGLAALRLGWAYCPAGIADVLHRVRGPFNVNAPALAAGAAAVRDHEHLARSRDHNGRCRDWFSTRARRLGLDVFPSAGNFLLLRFPDPRRPASEALAALKARGILLRGLAAYGLPDCLRITIGTRQDMRASATALEEFLTR